MEKKCTKCFKHSRNAELISVCNIIFNIVRFGGNHIQYYIIFSGYDKSNVLYYSL